MNRNYFIAPAVVDYVVDGVHLIANDGVKLLALYRFDPVTGLWHHRDTRGRPPVSRCDISHTSGAMEFRAQRSTAPERVLAEQLQQAPDLVTSLPDRLQVRRSSKVRFCPASFECIRWLPLPGEAQRELAAPARIPGNS